MIYALDTNTVSYGWRGAGRVADKLRGMQPAELALPSMVVHELENGLKQSPENSRRWQLFEALIGHVRVLPFDLASSREASRIKASLDTLGTPIGDFDLLIAATALAHGATLVTHNKREFARVLGLLVEDWF